MLPELLWPHLELLPGFALLQQLRETDVVKDVPKPIVGIARHPAIALGDVPARIDADEFVGAVLPPDAGQARTFRSEMVHQLIQWTKPDALLVPTLHPYPGQVDAELAQTVQVEDALVLGRIGFSAGERGVDLKVCNAEVVDKIGIEPLGAHLQRFLVGDGDDADLNAGLTRGTQLMIMGILIAVNAVGYALVIARRLRQRAALA